jgi:hypothetical protein
MIVRVCFGMKQLGTVSGFIACICWLHQTQRQLNNILIKLCS